MGIAPPSWAPRGLGIPQRTKAKIVAANTTTSAHCLPFHPSDNHAQRARDSLQPIPDGQVNAVHVGPAEERLPVLLEDAGEVAGRKAVAVRQRLAAGKNCRRRHRPSPDRRLRLPSPAAQRRPARKSPPPITSETRASTSPPVVEKCAAVRRESEPGYVNRGQRKGTQDRVQQGINGQLRRNAKNDAARRQESHAPDHAGRGFMRILDLVRQRARGTRRWSLSRRGRRCRG